jgi:hypothetical protein
MCNTLYLVEQTQTQRIRRLFKGWGSTKASAGETQDAVTAGRADFSF